MTVQRVSLPQLLSQPLEFVLKPPAFRFYLIHGLALVVSLIVVVWSVWDGQTGFGLIHWVGTIFGGTVLLFSFIPKNWDRDQLINLAFDSEHLYLVNGITKQAVVLPRSRVRAVNKGKLPGHDGAIIAFTLDLELDDTELALVVEIMGTQVEDRFFIDEHCYRFGFVGNWQPRQRLLATVAVLAPPELPAPPVVKEEDDDDEWD